MTCSHETLHELLAMKYIFNKRYLIKSRLNVQLDTNSVIYTLPDAFLGIQAMIRKWTTRFQNFKTFHTFF